MSDTLSAIWLEHLERDPDAIALTLLEADQAHDLSWRQIFLGAASFQQAYQARGLQAGELIVIILKHGEDLVSAFLGAILHGAIPAYMPFLTEKLSPQRYRQSLASLAEISKPAAIVTYADFEVEIESALTSETSVRQVLIAEGIRRLNELPESFPGIFRSSESVVLLQHSSGTTGLQKGVALSQRAVLNQIQAYRTAIRMSDSDVVVSWLPLYHDMGLIAGFLMPLLMGTRLVLMSPFDWVRAPYRLLQAVSHYAGTLSWLPNFAYNFCADKIRDRDLEGLDLSSWRAVINCSEPMHLSSHQKFAARFEPYGFHPEALATCYAMAENVFAVTQGGIEAPVVVDRIDRQALQSQSRAVPVQDENSVPMLSAGKPLANVELRILDQNRRPLGERRVGEIALRSDCMLHGYYHRDDLTAEAFHEGWYLTGDLGYLADGELYVSGRSKEMLIIGGKNVYPQDLEQITAEVPGIYPGRVVAFGIFDEKVGTEVVGLVAETELEAPEARLELANEIRARVTQGSDVTPRYVKVVDRQWLIKTSSGKIARQANRDQFVSQFLHSKNGSIGGNA